VIEVEIEDDAWTVALPEAEALVVTAAEAVLSARSSPPLRGRGQGEWGVSGTLVDGSAGAPTPDPSPQGGGDITILLTDDETVKALNGQFRVKPVPTNVLSFPAPATAAPHLGDIALAYGVCVREAQAQEKPLAHHLLHLTTHGVLHLLGYDHETDADAEVMEALERDILAGLGVPDPYAAEHCDTHAPDEADVPL